MKKEVTVCDTEDCKVLGDYQCALCTKDMCAAHAASRLVIQVQATTPATSVPGVPTGNVEVTQSAQDFATICRSCYKALQQLESGGAPNYSRNRIFVQLMGSFRANVIETAKAELAQQKLERS